jgi:DNA repair protein RadC
MAKTLYQKRRLVPDAQSFFADLTDLRALVADFTARYSTLEPAATAAEAATVQQPRDVVALVRPDVQHLQHEEFRVILLNTRNRVLDIVPLYRGTLNSAAVRVAEVFKPAIVASAAAMVVVHNHPSGDPTPSPEDVRVTGELSKAGRLLDIEVLDHIIIGHPAGPPDSGYVSLKQRGLGFPA